MERLRLLTADQVGEVLLIEPATIRGWLRTGKLKGSKLPGGDWRIHEEDVTAILLPTKDHEDIGESSLISLLFSLRLAPRFGVDDIPDSL